MFASLFTLAVAVVFPAAFGEPPALPEIASSIAASALDSSAGFCLLQRDQGQVRSVKEDNVAEEQARLPALPPAFPQAAVSSENKNATEVQLQSRKEETQPHSSSGSSSHSNHSSSHISNQSNPGVWHPKPHAVLAEFIEESGEPREKNKIALLIIEMCPLCWLFAVDRFYLGNTGLAIAKLVVSLGSCFIGGVVWGLVDFIIIITNALRQEETLHAAGMSAKFPKSQLHASFILAILDIVVVVLFIGIARFVWWWRKVQRMEKLKQAAMRSPHYGVDPRQVKS